MLAVSIPSAATFRVSTRKRAASAPYDGKCRREASPRLVAATSTLFSCPPQRPPFPPPPASPPPRGTAPPPPRTEGRGAGVVPPAFRPPKVPFCGPEPPPLPPPPRGGGGGGPRQEPFSRERHAGRSLAPALPVVR